MDSRARAWRWARPELLLLLVGVAGLGLTLLAQLLSSDLLRLGRWLSIGLYAANGSIAATGLVLTWRADRREAARARSRDVDSALALPAGPEDVPAAANADPYGELGVCRSRYIRGHDPYIRRQEVDEALDLALREGKFVLLVGKSLAGKSRCAFEAVRRTLPDARLLVARPGNATLARLLDLDPPLRAGTSPVVIWLDDLDRYLSAVGGIDVGLLAQLRTLAARVVVVATIRADRRQELYDTKGELGRAARLVLDQPTEVVVPSEMTAQEEAEARRLYPKEDFQRGIGEQLVAAPVLERRYQDGYLSDGIGRVGWAIVRAAIDWRRVAMFRPISDAELREPYRLYLPPRGRWVNPDNAAWADGLRWALAEPHHAPVALLEEQRSDTPARTFQAFDYIVSFAEDPGAPITPEIPAATWAFALARADSFELLQVAATAQTRQCDEVVDQAWRQAESTSEPLIASFAAFMEAVNLADRGDLAGAKSAYKRASSADADGNPTPALAEINLGQMLADEGDLAGAAAAWRRAIAFDDPIGTPVAAINLSALLRKQSDPAGARAAYELALATVARSGDASGIAGMVAHDLGALLAEQGEMGAARAAFEAAVASGHPTAGPRAAARLGILHREHGDRAAAAKAFRVAAAAKEPDVAASAIFGLGQLIEEDNPAGAEAAYRQVAAAGAPGVSPLAMLALGMLLETRGDIPGARTAYQRAVDSGHPVAAALAASSLGSLLERQGDSTGALAAYRRAASSGRPDVAPRAAFSLGTLLMDAGNLAGAESAYLLAVRSGHSDAAPRAEVALGVLLRKQGDPAGARSAYQRAVDSGHPDAAPAAEFNLGGLLEDQGDLTGARNAYRFAADSGHRQAAPLALIGLGDVLIKLGDVAGGRAAFERAARSGHPAAAKLAAKRLGWPRS